MGMVSWMGDLPSCIGNYCYHRKDRECAWPDSGVVIVRDSLSYETLVSIAVGSVTTDLGAMGDS